MSQKKGNADIDGTVFPCSWSPTMKEPHFTRTKLQKNNKKWKFKLIAKL
ncbi:hypothetical protein O23A_p2091 [Aeromonas salmonicida]|nr:hypothetical protein O23A_p2091 [Aeromonas salmonicida]